MHKKGDVLRMMFFQIGKDLAITNSISRKGSHIEMLKLGIFRVGVLQLEASPTIDSTAKAWGPTVPSFLTPRSLIGLFYPINYHRTASTAKRSIYKTHHGANNKYAVLRFQ